MSSKLLPVVSFVLVAALAQAQPRPAPRSPRPPQPPPAPAAPFALIGPDFEGLVDLDLRLDTLADLNARLDLELAPMLALNLRPSLDALAFELEGLGQEGSGGRAGDLESIQYSRGTRYLDQRRYQQALDAFDKVVAVNGKRMDGALYWKAYCLGRLGRGSEALSTLDTLLKKYPSSRWANDGRALQVELRQASGRPINPQQESDEELKLLALNGIMARDPERGIPLVEQVLNSSASPRMKERALFVLGQSGSPRAKALLTDIAKGKGNPDLQIKALEYLGVFGGGPDVPLLMEVYKSSSDTDVKRRVIRSLAMAGGRGFHFNFDFVMPELPDMSHLFGEAAAAGGQLPEAERLKAEADLRAEVDRARAEGERARIEADRALRDAGLAEGRSARSAERDKARQAKAKEASDALWQLYQVEPSVELKREILRNMYVGDQSDRLLQIARTEKSPELREAALHGLMFNRSPKTADSLVALYKEQKDPASRRQIVETLGAMGAAGALVQVARQETDPQLRRRIVQRLSLMKDKEATDYLEELLKK